MSTKRKVNLFLVGAAKSGTTSLAELLKQHDDIHVPYYKEPFYFVDGNGIDSYDDYINLYKEKMDVKYLVDASTGYLSDYNSALNIFKYNAESKILIILRNPIDFCVSYWRYMKVNGHEDLDFNEAISDKVQSYRNTKEFVDSIDDWPNSYQYIERGKFYNQVKSYIDIFGRDKVKVVVFENLINDEQGLKSIFEFLDIPHNNLLKLPKENGSGEVNKFFHFLRFSKKLKKVKGFMKGLINDEIRLKVRKKMISYSTVETKKVEVNYDRAELKAIFSRDVELLKKLLPKVNFDTWQDFE